MGGAFLLRSSSVLRRLGFDVLPVALVCLALSLVVGGGSFDLGSLLMIWATVLPVYVWGELLASRTGRVGELERRLRSERRR